uniref:EMI domain-containing protein n=1 Tax=Phasianus colchicus TaxID=9054 RepID=A0A669PFT3_PHACC
MALIPRHSLRGDNRAGGGQRPWWKWDPRGDTSGFSCSNWCSYMVTRTVTCLVQNGTSLQRVFQGCRWPPGCGGGSYRTVIRPAYRVAYRTLTALEWKCCPGHSGANCEEGGNGVGWWGGLWVCPSGLRNLGTSVLRQRGEDGAMWGWVDGGTGGWIDAWLEAWMDGGTDGGGRDG